MLYRKVLERGNHRRRVGFSLLLFACLYLDDWGLIEEKRICIRFMLMIMMMTVAENSYWWLGKFQDGRLLKISCTCDDQDLFLSPRQRWPGWKRATCNRRPVLNAFGGGTRWMAWHINSARKKPNQYTGRHMVNCVSNEENLYQFIGCGRRRRRTRIN